MYSQIFCRKSPFEHRAFILKSSTTVETFTGIDNKGQKRAVLKSLPEDFHLVDTQNECLQAPTETLYCAICGGKEVLEITSLQEAHEAMSALNDTLTTDIDIQEKIDNEIMALAIRTSLFEWKKELKSYIRAMDRK